MTFEMEISTFAIFYRVHELSWLMFIRHSQIDIQNSFKIISFSAFDCLKYMKFIKKTKFFSWLMFFTPHFQKHKQKQ